MPTCSDLTSVLGPPSDRPTPTDRPAPSAGTRLPRPGTLSETDLDRLERAFTLDALLTLLAGTAAGAVLATLIVPAVLPDLTASLIGEEPKAFWYLSRSSGVVAYLALWLSAVLGLTLTNRLARLWAGGPAVADLHQFASVLALALVTFHAIVLLGDRYAAYRIDQLLIPFTAQQHEPFWVGLGQLAAYLALLVTGTFYIRRQIGVRTWRLIHYGAFAVYALSVAHALGAGTDSRTALMLGMYLATGGAVLFLTTYRIMTAVIRPSRAPASVHAGLPISARKPAGQAKRAAR